MGRAVIFFLLAGGLIAGAVESVRADANQWEASIFVILAAICSCFAIASVASYKAHKNWR